MDFEKKNGDTSIAATKTIKSILSKREKVAKEQAARSLDKDRGRGLTQLLTEYITTSRPDAVLFGCWPKKKSKSSKGSVTQWLGTGRFGLTAEN